MIAKSFFCVQTTKPTMSIINARWRPVKAAPISPGITRMLFVLYG